MCGIAGYTGKGQVLDYILSILTFLEYRGYDSAGIAYFKDDGSIGVVKTKGNIDNLKKKLSSRDISSDCIIGHTRWATHGEPSDANAHPHGTENVQIVHNGIIENSDDIRSFLWENGYDFVSRTDTEACAKLIDYYFKKSSNPIDAIKKAAYHLKGSYAVAAVFDGFENTIYAFRKDSPLIVAPSSEGCFVVSDISALSGYADSFYSVDEDEVVRVCADAIEFVDVSGEVRTKRAVNVTHSKSQGNKDEYPHYMLKEIYEDEASALATFESTDLNFFKDNYREIHIVGCGTAYNAGLCASYCMEKISGVPVRVHTASEFRYYTPVLSKDGICIFVSQSGETADTLAALRLANSFGVKTLAMVNSPLSAMAKEADYVILTKAGQEVSVASTKAYVSQLAAFCVLMESMEKTDASFREICTHLTPNEKTTDVCRELASFLAKSKNVFFIGRGQDYAIACEAALKAREVSYVNCNAYPAGELKHGSIALIEKGTPIVAIVTEEATADKVISNINEVKSRGAKVAVIVRDGIDIPSDIADWILYLPKAEDMYMPLIAAPAIQLIAYYMATELGVNPDRPRNLAKSVTVE